jgi:hypothetical protein
MSCCFLLEEHGSLARSTRVPAPLVRIDAAAGIVFVLPCFPGFVSEQSKGKARTGGGILYRCLVIVGFGTIYCTYFYFYHDPLAIRMGVIALIVYSLFVTAPFWSAVYKALIMGRGYQMPPTDESCGPIAWRGFGDGQEPQALA